MTRRLVSFGLALAVTAIAFVPWLAFGNNVQPRYALLLVAVIVVARYLGLWPAMLSTAAAALFVLLEYQSSAFGSATTWLQFAIFVGLAVFVSEVVAATERAAQNFKAAHAEAEAAKDELAQQSQTFLATAAHDLKAPLTSIKGTAQVMLRRLSNGEVMTQEQLRTELERIDGLSNRMASALNNLMDATRLEVGSPLDLIVRPVDLAQVARRLIADYRRRPGHPRIELQSEPDQIVTTVDQFRIERVLENLLSNAIKYGKGQPISVCLSLPEDETNRRVRLVVADQGIGIDPTDLPYIFERFRRGSNVGGLPGAGIGLTGAKQIIEQHGGTIEVESTSGHGTRFIVELPLDEDVPAASRAQAI